MDWEKGDLELLPVTRTENVHQHMNLEMGKPCGLLVIMFGPFIDCLANEGRQIDDAPAWKGPRREELYRKEDFITKESYIEGYPMKIDRPATLLDNLYLRRNLWREKMSKARWIIKQKDQPQELNRMGFYRWYIHPSFEDVAYKAILFWTHEIPPGSRSGKQKFQGGRLHYILEGQGHTMVNGLRYDWESQDVLIPPILSGGVIVQHFNTDPLRPVKMACAEPNWYEILGMDMASGYEQIEDCPEWMARSSLS